LLLRLRKVFAGRRGLAFGSGNGRAVLVVRRLAFGERLALHDLVAVAAMALRAALAMTAAASTTTTAAALFVLVLGLALVARFLFEQGLPVGDRDLIIVGVDFRKGQKSVAIAAVIDEGRLEGRFD